MLKVAYITMAFPARTETFATNDVRTLKAHGVEVAVHSMRPRDREMDRLADTRGVGYIRRTYTSGWSLVRGFGLLARRPGLTASLLWRILSTSWSRPEHLSKSLVLIPRTLEIFDDVSRNRPDVVHVYWGHYPSLVGLLVLDRLPETICTMSLAAYDLEAQYGPSKVLAPRVPMVRTLGEVNVEAIRRDYGVPRERIEVIYDGVDLARLPEPSDRSKVEGRVVVVSRLVPEKGVDDALRAFAKVRESVPGVTLRVMGEGPERKHLEQMAESLGISDAAEFLGHVDHERVLAELAAAEVLLFMSKKSSERLPNVVKEAMACGAVCVATPTPGIDELIEQDETGWIVPIGAVEEAAERVRSAMTSRGDTSIDVMRTRAEAYIRSRFDLERCVRRYIDRWAQLVRDRRAGSAGRGASETA